MELRDVLELGRRWLWLFLLAASVGAVGAWVGTRFIQPTYSASSTLMVGRINDDNFNASAIYTAERLAMTYAQMVTREGVLKAVVDELELPVSWRQLRGMVKARPQPGAPLFEVHVVSTNSDLSQVLANTVAETIVTQSRAKETLRNVKDQGFVEEQLEVLRSSIDNAAIEIDDLESELDTATSARQISEVKSQLSGKHAQINEWQRRYTEMRDSLIGSTASAVSVIEEANPGYRVGPNVRANVLTGALLGLALALVAVLVLEYMDDTVRSPEFVERKLGIPGLAAVQLMPAVERRADGLPTINRPRSPIAETYRSLRTNLEFALLQRDEGPMVVTSANPGEGKSTTAANLAVVFAQAGRKVILLDGDLRKPSLHRFFDLTNGFGFTSLILDPSIKPEEAMHPVPGLDKLSILTSGPLPPNPSEILGSERAQELISKLCESADLVIIDSPPTLLVTDPVVLSGNAAGTLLVFDAVKTRTDMARRTLEIFRKVGIEPLGAVVNKLDEQRSGYYYRHAYYKRGYGDDGDAYGGYFDSDNDDNSSGRGRSQPSEDGGVLGQVRQRLAHTISSLLS